MYNLLFVLFLASRLIMSHQWLLIIPIIIFAWPVQWCLRWLSKDDPTFISGYFEAIKQPLIYHPSTYEDDT